MNTMNAGNNPGTASEVSVPKTWEKILNEINYALG
jgi:hypothetical protein